VGSPVAVAASALGGTAPLSYAWDLNGDGAFGDATSQTASFPATTAGTFPISVRVTDSSGSATKCHGPKKKCPGPQQAVASTSVTVKPPPAPKAVLQSWSFDGADGMCDAQKFTTFTVAADPLAPAAQTQKWHTVTEQAASGPCAWYHGVDQLQTYPSAQYTSLVSPCVDLSGLTTASAEFKYAGELWAEDDGTPVDYLEVGVTPCDANDFTGITQFSGVAGELDASPAVYKTASVDLSPYAGQKIKVEFDMHTNLLQVGYRGYQIDDVSLLGS
jgi:hypothetical protein